jgi:hypothetical protein
VIALIASLLPVAQAAPLWCDGQPTQLWVAVNGTVTFSPSYRGDHTSICSLNSEWQSVPTQTCWSWFAILSTAIANGRSVRVYYDVPYTCSTLPTYGNSPAPSYVMLQP